jgi:Domain of unknown function (DUF4170)
MTTTSDTFGEQLLHLVFGGELEDISGVTFKDLDKLAKAKARGSVGNSEMRRRPDPASSRAA